MQLTPAERAYLERVLLDTASALEKELANLNPDQCPGAHESATRQRALAYAVLEKLGTFTLPVGVGAK